MAKPNTSDLLSAIGCSSFLGFVSIKTYEKTFSGAIYSCIYRFKYWYSKKHIWCKHAF